MTYPTAPHSGEDLLAGLDPEQRAVATALHGPVCVLAGGETATTQLEYLKNPRLPFRHARGAQGDDRVRHGELGRVRGVGPVVLADPE